ncbi:paired immunoglobulin-like type 2 receptor alpha [Perognathus longimembris pacificus]|uniref:paired immunoglobulin-like type 2 receptor alpha n=1 Tax=Perognathus longimembris pacificus TaxID=214514 RepID=UPI00201949DF|nr:paired immunoglobulin-like type 2 receptor alpha [Perognathus longimembris pacificus]
MRQVLVVLLLLPAAVLAAADSPYLMIQPEHLSAFLGGSVEIPFRFSHAWELAPDPQVKLSWRWKSFYGEFIYNSTPPFIHKQFKDRLVLIIAEDGVSGSLSISNLHKRDGTTYFCRVHLKTKQHGEKQWQSIIGTKLTITKAIKPTTQTKTTTERSTSVTSEVTSTSFTVAQSQPLGLGAVVGMAVAITMLIIGVLGLLALLRCRRKEKSWPTLGKAGQAQPKPQQGEYVAPKETDG